MVGYFTVPEGVDYRNNQTIGDIRFEGEVIVTIDGTIPFAYFDGSNYDNSHFDGIFYFEFLKDLPPNARFEGYIDSNGEFTGRFISGNNVESVSNIRINNANALLRI
jgi:hypothetical protein